MVLSDRFVALIDKLISAAIDFGMADPDSPEEPDAHARMEQAERVLSDAIAELEAKAAARKE